MKKINELEKIIVNGLESVNVKPLDKDEGLLWEVYSNDKNLGPYQSIVFNVNNYDSLDVNAFEYLLPKDLVSNLSEEGLSKVALGIVEAGLAKYQLESFIGTYRQNINNLKAKGKDELSRILDSEDFRTEDKRSRGKLDSLKFSYEMAVSNAAEIIRNNYSGPVVKTAPEIEVQAPGGGHFKTPDFLGKRK